MRPKADAYALIAGILGMFVTLALHPTGHEVLAPGPAGERAALIGVVAHGIAIATLPLLLFGFLGFSRRPGSGGALSELAYICYALGCVAVLVAAAASGFVTTGVLRHIIAGNEGAKNLLKMLFAYTGVWNQAFAGIHLVATSAAVVLWSIGILRRRVFGAGVGAFGLLVGGATLAAYLAGFLTLNLHGFGLMLLAQAAWTLWIAALLLRAPASVS